MRYFTVFLCLFFLIATGLPLINTDEWWIRIFDFPRAQIMFIGLLAIILCIFYFKENRKYQVPLILLLASALIYQLQDIIVYTPLYRAQAKGSSVDFREESFTLLVSNVRMDNVDKKSLLSLVEVRNPDIILITEPDQEWADALEKLDREYTHAVKKPLPNTYGMILLSKFPLSESEINFLVKEDIPSIFTEITLPSGQIFDFYGVHPEPPKPGTDTYERDTELLIIGREIKEEQRPVIVAGDLNDVGWSRTSKLFRKYSKLVDPREGRGLYNTYSVFIPLLRYPLDHIFYSNDFGLTSISKLENIGSDHFPIMITLTFEPNQAETVEEPSEKEKEEVEEKMEKEK